MRKKLTDGRVVVSRRGAVGPSAAGVKLTRFLNGARLPFAPTQSQPVTSAEAKLMPQVKRDRAFLAGEAVGEPVPLLSVAKLPLPPMPGRVAPVAGKVDA